MFNPASNRSFEDNVIAPLYLIRLNDFNWETAISHKEYSQLIQNGTFAGRPTYNLTALFIPIRNHNFEAFLEDLNLPLVFNLALKVDGIVARIFAVFFCLPVDIVTLPIRLLFTAIPRFFHNQPLKKEHLFYQFLQKKGFDPDLLERIDSCCVNLLYISKTVKANGKILDIELKAGVRTNYEGEKFSINFVEQAFVGQQFTGFNGSVFGWSFSGDLYKRCYLQAYPHVSNQEFEEIEKRHNDYLKTDLLKRSGDKFFMKLNQHIPDIIAEIKKSEKEDDSCEEIYARLKKAYHAFARNFHSDKTGGDKVKEEIFIQIKEDWEKLEPTYKNL